MKGKTCYINIDHNRRRDTPSIMLIIISFITRNYNIG